MIVAGLSFVTIMFFSADAVIIICVTITQFNATNVVCLFVHNMQTCAVRVRQTYAITVAGKTIHVLNVLLSKKTDEIHGRI